MVNNRFKKTYEDLIRETKHSTHGYWKLEDFKEWGRQALHLIDELCGVTSQYYTLFLRTHHSAIILGTNDSKFSTHVSLCISILKSVYSEFTSDSKSELI